MKKLLKLLSLILLFGLVACSPKKDPDPTPGPTPDIVEEHTEQFEPIN